MNADRGSVDIVRLWPDSALPGLEMHEGIRVFESAPRHLHHKYELGVVEQGCAEFRLGKFKGLVPEGTFVLIPPGTAHEVHSPSASGCSFRAAYLPPRLIDGDANEDPLPTTFAGNSRAASLLHSTLGSLALPGSRLEQEALVDQLRVDLRRALSRAEEPLESPQMSPGVRRAKEYLEAYYAEENSVDQLAELASITSFRFVRQFRRQVGLPPYAYQTQLRVEHAKYLIAKGWPLSEVALDSGFYDQSHLNRHFKRLTRVTPGQYAEISKRPFVSLAARPLPVGQPTATQPTATQSTEVQPATEQPLSALPATSLSVSELPTPPSLQPLH